MSLMYHDTVIAGTPVIDNTPTAGSNHAVSSGGVKSAITNVESDLASIHATGSTNTTGAKIDAGTYFYLNDVLVRAKTDIAVNATFTSGTNYETVTAGGLNDLKNAIAFSPTERTTITIPSNGYLVPADSWYRIIVDGTSATVGIDINDLPSLYADQGHKFNQILCLRKGAVIKKAGNGVIGVQFMGLA